jgi:hypothetical protein
MMKALGWDVLLWTSGSDPDAVLTGGNVGGGRSRSLRRGFPSQRKADQTPK